MSWRNTERDVRGDCPSRQPAPALVSRRRASGPEELACPRVTETRRGPAQTDAGLPALRRRGRRTCRLPFCDGDEEALVQRTSDLRLWYTNALYTWSFTVSFSYVMMRFSISFL